MTAAGGMAGFRTDAVRAVGALGLGTAGGFVFDAFDLPLAWMIGAMVATAAAAVCRARIRVPYGLRSAMVMVLGIMLGSAFDPTILDQLGRWSITLASLILFILICIAVGFCYLRWIAGYDPVTSYFTAAPGGFNEMLIVGAALGGDERTIALSHSARVMLVVFTIPIWFQLFADYEAAARAQDFVGLGDLAAGDALLLAVCAAGGPVALAMRIPAAWLVGPMVLSAAFHLVGWTDSRPPDLLIAIAQIVVGSYIGCRFVGVAPRRVGETALVAAGLTILLLGVTVAFALGLNHLTGIPTTDLVLAFAPGGLAEMSLVALALDVDAAFVSTHHLFRIVIIILFAPALFAVTRRALSSGKDGKT